MNFLPSQPTLKISPKNFTFNAACMKLLPDAEYVQFWHNFSNGILFVKECSGNEGDLTPWRRNCTSHEVRAKKVKWIKFYDLICEKMNWSHGGTYSIPARMDTYNDEPVIIFELTKSKSADDEWMAQEFQRLAESELIPDESGLTIRPATTEDLAILTQHDHHIAADVLAQKIERGEVYVAYDGEEFVGWLRWSLFWDNTPFMNMLFLLPEHRGEGYGKQLTEYWENEMRAKGYKTLMTSTQQNESAQHFYTRLGYRSVGGFVQPDGEYEIIFVKEAGDQ
ncbi:hypothetical protein FACS1894217_04110 [Clostridia bacterium]|nr:hypothetical protein FACS1894217_04110 [Clostridia bacterium]